MYNDKYELYNLITDSIQSLFSVTLTYINNIILIKFGGRGGVDVLFDSFGILFTDFSHNKTFLNKVKRRNFLYILYIYTFLKEHDFDF